MKKQNKLTYETPTLTVVEFRTERGFATSNTEDNFVKSAHQAVDAYIANELGTQFQVGAMENGNVVASYLGENEDMSNAGGSSGWQYANGGWF